MEMTMDIDESIKELSKWRKDLNYDRGDYCYGGTTTKHSLDVAINIIRKYQKITKILNSASYTENGTVYSYTYNEDTRVKHIREVIKDGNDR